MTAGFSRFSGAGADRPREAAGGRVPPPDSAGRVRRPWVPAAWLALALAVAAAAPGPGRAQTVRPWVPPSADSLLRWATEAKVRFQVNVGDSVTGENFRAYELVGLMGRRLVRSLGPANLFQAHAVEATMDSLGLDVDVQVDPALMRFVLIMVRNPHRPDAHAVGFLYWYRDDDLRMQGVVFFGGHRPLLRAWWTGYRNQPYTLGVVDHERRRTGPMRVTIFRLDASASFLHLLQAPGQGPDPGEPGEATWADVNDDGRPELVVWVRAQNDTLFEACPSCPPILHEHIYAESRTGFRLHDMRVLPTPYSIFTLFVRLLADGNRAAAARLLRDPSKVDEAIASGWGSRRRARSWVLEYAEEERWPTWLAFLHDGPRGKQRYIVHFEQNDGRWIIREWLKPRPAGADRDSMAAPAPARRPGTGAPPKPGGSGRRDGQGTP